VNRAFRLESAAKAANWDVALGEETYRLAESLPEVRGLFQRSTLQLKGYTEPVTAWGASFEALLPALVRLNQEAPEK
jgi:adenylate cyclase